GCHVVGTILSYDGWCDRRGAAGSSDELAAGERAAERGLGQGGGSARERARQRGPAGNAAGGAGGVAVVGDGGRPAAGVPGAAASGGVRAGPRGGVRPLAGPVAPGDARPRAGDGAGGLERSCAEGLDPPPWRARWAG